MMDRRRFLEALAVTAAGVNSFQGVAQKAGDGKSSSVLNGARGSAWRPAANIDVEGHTLVCEFTADNQKWRVYEDLRTSEGAMTFLSSRGEGRLEQAPTRWGRVNFKMESRGDSSVVASIDLDRAGAPKELHVKFRLPTNHTLQTITVNSRPATVGGIHRDTAIFPTQNQRHFDVVVHFS
jgi:hypothetical protein